MHRIVIVIVFGFGFVVGCSSKPARETGCQYLTQADATDLLGEPAPPGKYMKGGDDATCEYSITKAHEVYGSFRRSEAAGENNMASAADMSAFAGKPWLEVALPRGRAVRAEDNHAFQIAVGTARLEIGIKRPQPIATEQLEAVIKRIAARVK